MTPIIAKAGEIIRDGSYPPTMVCADVWDGQVTLLKADHAEESIEFLLQEAARIRDRRKARNKRLDKRHRVGYD